MRSEVNANIHRALGCVDTVTDGGIRDFDEMTKAAFKALARHLCVGHTCAYLLRWNCPVTVFGSDVLPGQLVIANQHGFINVSQKYEKNCWAQHHLWTAPKAAP